MEKRAAVCTGDEWTVLGNDPAVPHQDLAHLGDCPHFVDHLDQWECFRDGVGVWLLDQVGVNLLHFND